MNWNRVFALVIHHLYLMKGNVARLFILVFWPVLELSLWGFASYYLQKNQNIPELLNIFLSGLFFWVITNQSMLETLHPIVEDMNSRNFKNILISPIKPLEIIVALIISSLIKVSMVCIILFIFSLILFSFNILYYSYWLFPIFLNLLILGWSLGIITFGLILCFGRRIDFLSSIAAALLLPFSCAFYSREILPPLFKFFSWLSPASYVFEGIRNLILYQNRLDLATNLVISLGINVIYLMLSIFIFLFLLKAGRRRGIVTYL